MENLKSQVVLAFHDYKCRYLLLICETMSAFFQPQSTKEDYLVDQYFFLLQKPLNLWCIHEEKGSITLYNQRKS